MIDWTIKKTIKVKNITKHDMWLTTGAEGYKTHSFAPSEVKEIPSDLIYIKTDGSGDLFVKVEGLKVVEEFSVLAIEPINNRFEIMDL